MASPRDRLIRLLQNAHAGELAAFYAYDGHWKSLRDPVQRAEIQKIQKEEWEHRECVARMLKSLGAGPNPWREHVFWCIGHFISAFCRVGGWFIPMYGAGKLERGNIVEYADAAMLAIECGHPELVEELIQMAIVEWEHERYFDRQCRTHVLSKVFPMWSVPERPSLPSRDQRSV